jgi:hypothetical protein
MPQNKGMKLTRSAPAGEPRPLQLIPGVLRTSRRAGKAARMAMATEAA